MGLAMIRQAFKRLWNDKRGNALLIAGAAMPLVIGSAGLGADTIQWALWKRQLQRAADSAAIAGVYARVQSQNVTTAVTTDVTKNNQTRIALLNAPVITYPTGWNNAVAVRLQIQERLNFSSMFMAAPPTITASATAAGIDSGRYCVISLENTSATGISAGGTANVDLGCGMKTNSTSLEAAVAFGSSVIKADPVAAVGGLDKTDNWATGTTLLPFTIAQPDPFAGVNPPTIPSPCNSPARVNSNQSGTFAAGCYSTMDFSGNATLGDGTYVVTGDVTVGAQAHVSCNSCTIILTNPNPANSGVVTINGGAEIDMKAQTTGDYAGILFYQNRNATANLINKINGNSDSSFQGAFYFPNQEVLFNGTAGLTYECLQLVSRRVTFTGTSAITNNCPANSGAGAKVGLHVRLVA
jgi:Flp pilus assembly protein TadG